MRLEYSLFRLSVFWASAWDPHKPKKKHHCQLKTNTFKLITTSISIPQMTFNKLINTPKI